MTSLSNDVLLGRLAHALGAVVSDEPSLWTYGATEWAIAAQVFARLHRMQWPSGVSVDSEWDRQGMLGQQKVRSEQARARPDLIVHRRGRGGPENNLMLVEFKRDGLESNGSQGDVTKVVELMGRHDYGLGVVVSLGLLAIDACRIEARGGEFSRQRLELDLAPTPAVWAER